MLRHRHYPLLRQATFWPKPALYRAEQGVRSQTVNTSHPELLHRRLICRHVRLMLLTLSCGLRKQQHVGNRDNPVRTTSVSGNHVCPQLGTPRACTPRPSQSQKVPRKPLLLADLRRAGRQPAHAAPRRQHPRVPGVPARRRVPGHAAVQPRGAAASAAGRGAVLPAPRRRSGGARRRGSGCGRPDGIGGAPCIWISRSTSAGSN